MKMYEEKVKQALKNHREFLKDGEKLNVKEVSIIDPISLTEMDSFEDGCFTKCKKIGCTSDMHIESIDGNSGRPTLLYHASFTADVQWTDNQFEIKINNPIVLRLK